MSALLHVRHVSLDRTIEVQDTVSPARAGSMMATLARRDRRRQPVLHDIDFQAVDGDRIGILGLNGAGKTTLLRVLNGGLPPTRGEVERRGTVQSLLNPTLGFDEDATVSENVFLRGTAMGLRRRQLRAVLGDVLGFAGLDKKANHPLQSLSAGQRMRLGFSISTAVQPDILLMDEWLSTGDAAFLERAQQRMTSRFQGSRIVCLATHSPALVRAMCNKALVLEQGRMRFFGGVDDALEDYRGLVSGENAALREQLAKDDPLLFGDSTGVVERIRVAGPLVEIQGWAESGKGREVGVVSIELDGNAQILDTFDRVDREDVRLHLGRNRGCFGFRVVINRGRSDCAAGIPERVRVSVGRSRRHLGAPLPLAVGAIVEVARQELSAVATAG